MVGFVSGYLEVEREARSNNSRQKEWVCNCKRCPYHDTCEKPEKDNVIVSGIALRRHKVNSCGHDAHYTVEDLRGKKFGLLRVRNEMPKKFDKYSKPYWVCNCEGWKYGFDNCKKTIMVRAEKLKSGKVKSCGCNLIINEKEEIDKKGRLIIIWRLMIFRCNNSKNYKGRGIKICDRWKNPDNFIEDNIDKYEPGLTIDRIDVNGDYEPDNCRWVDNIVQANNKTDNVYLNIGDTDISVTVAQYTRLYSKIGLDSSTVAERISDGWTPEEAVQIPKLFRKDPETGKFYRNKNDWLEDHDIKYNMIDFINRIEKEKNNIKEQNQSIIYLPEDYPEDTTEYKDDECIDINVINTADIRGEFDLTTIENYGPFKKIIYIGSKNTRGMYRVVYMDDTYEDLYRNSLIRRIEAYRNGEELPGHKKTYRDILGQKFNMLTVIRSLDKEEVIKLGLNSTSRSGHWWECRCDCGNTCYHTTHELICNDAKSCGCLHNSNFSPAYNYCGKETTVGKLANDLANLINPSVSRKAFIHRIESGWTLQEAICTPKGVDKDKYKEDHNIRPAVTFDESLKGKCESAEEKKDNGLGFKFTIVDKDQQ